MIRFCLPGLPISINAFYMTIKKGKRTIRAITKEGRAYKKESVAHLVRRYPSELAKMEKDQPYLVVARLHFKSILNKSWPETAKTRYKKLDGTNRVKVLEDVISEATGVDDAQNLTFIVEKCQTDEEERTEVWLWNTEKEESPFDEVLHDLPTM